MEQYRLWSHGSAVRTVQNTNVTSLLYHMQSVLRAKWLRNSKQEIRFSSFKLRAQNVLFLSRTTVRQLNERPCVPQILAEM